MKIRTRCTMIELPEAKYCATLAGAAAGPIGYGPTRYAARQDLLANVDDVVEY